MTATAAMSMATCVSTDTPRELVMTAAPLVAMTAARGGHDRSTCGGHDRRVLVVMTVDTVAPTVTGRSPTGGR